MIPQVESRREEIAALCRQFEVRRLDIFGSGATGAFRDGESDLDFLVEFESEGPEGAFDRYFGLKEALEDLFGASVDLVVAEGIRNPYFREAVEESRALLYAA